MNDIPATPQVEHKAKKLPFVILALLGLGLIGYCIFGVIAFVNPKQSAPAIAMETATAAIPVTEVNSQIPENVLQIPSEDALALMDESVQWTVILEDGFDTDLNENNWNMGEISTPELEHDLKIKDGKYLWGVRTKHTVLASLNPNTFAAQSNFRLSADVKLASGTYKPVYGVIFRDNPNGDGYFFGIYGETFIIDRYYGGEHHRFVESPKISAIRPQESNRLTVIANDSLLVFMINEQFVFELVDDSIEQGLVGYAAVFYHIDLENTFEFDNFIVQVP